MYIEASLLKIYSIPHFQLDTLNYNFYSLTTGGVSLKELLYVWVEAEFFDGSNCLHLCTYLYGS